MGDVVRRLVVVRHGKSAWPFGVPDRERPLGRRGTRDAPLMARRIADLVGTLDLAVVSPARRARETWELMAAGLEVGHVRTEPRVYHSWGTQLLDVVAELPDDAARVLVLGHEPGVSELVLTLADPADRDLRGQVGSKFPTCAAAVLVASRPWDQFAPGCAQLEAFRTPRG